MAEEYEKLDSMLEQILQAPAYKDADKWVVRRTRNLLHEIADAGTFDGFEDDTYLLYITSFLSGYAARIDKDYNREDTIADPALADTETGKQILDMLSGYQPYIQARAIHFIIENYPGEEDYGDQEFAIVALYTALGFANGFVGANSGDEDDEVAAKMSARQLTEKQCQNAANAAVAKFPISKAAAGNLALRIKELSDKELLPRSGVKKGYPITDDPVGVLRMYATGYAVGVLHAVNVKDGNRDLGTSKFNVPDYMKLSGRLWTTWCYRQQHSNLVRRASKDGWTFYLDKDNAIILNNIRDYPELQGDDNKATTKLLNNLLAYEFMRGWTDGFADEYEGRGE